MPAHPLQLRPTAASDKGTADTCHVEAVSRATVACAVTFRGQEGYASIALSPIECVMAVQDCGRVGYPDRAAFATGT